MSCGGPLWFAFWRYVLLYALRGHSEGGGGTNTETPDSGISISHCPAHVCFVLLSFIFLLLSSLSFFLFHFLTPLMFFFLLFLLPFPPFSGVHTLPWIGFWYCLVASDTRGYVSKLVRPMPESEVSIKSLNFKDTRQNKLEHASYGHV